MTVGQKWRRAKEGLMQTVPVTSRGFKSTSNARNEAMFKEATDFSMRIKLLEKDLKSVLKSLESHCKNLRTLLLSPVPRVYEEGENGPVPVGVEALTLGRAMDVEAIPRAAEQARTRVNEEVIAPLYEWMKAYDHAAAYMRQCEALRLDLDARRRGLANLEGRIARLRANLGTTKHRGEAEVKELEDVAAAKQEKLDRTEKEFSVTEATTYNSLVVIVRDSSVLRDYTHTALTIVQESFAQAAAAYTVEVAPQQSGNYMMGYGGGEGANAGGAQGGPMAALPNKYEAQLTGSQRATPKGLLTNMLDRLRKKGPPSPARHGDAASAQDQMPYGMAHMGGPGGMYGGHGMPAPSQMAGGHPGMGGGYGPSSGAGMQIPMPSQYIQQVGMPPANPAAAGMTGGTPNGSGRYRETNGYAPYVPQHTGGQSGPVPVGMPSAPPMMQAGMGYGAPQQYNHQQPPQQYNHQMSPHHHRGNMYDQHQHHGQPGMAAAGGGTGWTNEGY